MNGKFKEVVTVQTISDESRRNQYFKAEKGKSSKNLNYTVRRGENLRIKTNKIMLCPIMKCTKKYKYVAALENHIIKCHGVEIDNNSCEKQKPKEDLRKEDYPPKLRRIIDNFASSGEFLLKMQGVQELNYPQAQRLNWLPEYNTHNYIKELPSLYPLENSTKLLNYPPTIQPNQQICPCGFCVSSDNYPRVPSPRLKVYFLNEGGNRFDSFNYHID